MKIIKHTTTQKKALLVTKHLVEGTDIKEWGACFLCELCAEALPGDLFHQVALRAACAELCLPEAARRRVFDLALEEGVLQLDADLVHGRACLGVLIPALGDKFSL